MVKVEYKKVAGIATAAALEREVAYIEIGTPAVRLSGAKRCNFHRISDTVLPHLDDGCRCLIVSATTPGEATAVMEQWRASQKFGALPAFTTIQGDDRLSSLVDGVVSSLDDVSEQAAPIENSLRELSSPKNLEGADRLLLAYLFARPQQRLKPVKTPSDLRLYHYPVADAMAPRTTSSEVWLRSLVSRGYLDQTQLTDRLHRCGNCDCALLSFTDACVACRSVDIEAKQFLHCFTCGHVAPEERFVRRQGLACPQCTKRLRHIGTDYDRPLEDNVCNDCGHHFAGGRAVARCLGCEQTNDPEDLVVTRFFEMALSEKGLLAARSGMLDQSSELVDAYRYATPGYLSQMLDWLLALCARHAEECFSLVSIRIANMEHQVEQSGEIAAWERTETLAKRLTALTRDTDLLARMGRLETWVLLPKTDTTGCQQFCDQVLALTASLQADDGDQLDLSLNSVSVPEQVSAELSADAVLARLREDT